VADQDMKPVTGTIPYNGSKSSQAIDGQEKVEKTDIPLGSPVIFICIVQEQKAA
jgi:hypothetical protein